MIDSVFSLRAAYPSTERVLDRYRAVRRAAGGDPNRDGLADLVATIDETGGPNAAAGPALFDNRAYAPGTVGRGRTGVHKAAAVYEGATSLQTAGIDTTADLLDNTEGAAAMWSGVRGLGRVSWAYLLMLAGTDGVKADTMVRRFVAAAVGVQAVNDERARLAVEGAAELIDADTRVLDHAIWLYQRQR